MNKHLYLAILLLGAPALALAEAVDYMEFRTVQPLPVLTVTSDGQTYTSASSNGPLVFRTEAKAKCNKGFKAAFASVTLDVNASNVGANLAAYVDLDAPNGNAMTWSSNWKPMNVSWNPNSAVRNQAVQACNAELQKRVQAGQNARDVLGKGFSTTIDPYYLGFNFACNDYGLLRFSRHTYKDAVIQVQCAAHSFPAPKPQVPSGGGGGFKPALQLTDLDLDATPNNYKGACPKNIPFHGTISTNGAGGEVQYRFLKDGQPQSPYQKLVLKNGEKTGQVSYMLQATAPAQQPQQPQQPLGIQGQNNGVQLNNLPGLAQQVPKIELEARNGQQVLKIQAQYSYTCELPQLQVGILKPAKPGDSGNAGKPDVTSRVGMTIASHSAPWGGVINVGAADASQTTPRGCRFRMAYDVVNIGTAASGPFVSRLFDGGGPAIHTQGGMNLDAGQSAKASGTILLAPGSHLLRASLDDVKQVDESNEGNNLFRITVNVADDCGQGSPGRPGTPPRGGGPRPAPGPQ